MAGVIGSNSGGYATVAPTDNYVGQAMANVQDSQFQYKAFQEAKDKARLEQEQAMREAQDKKDKELLEYQEKHKLTKTGVRPIDTKNYEIALKLQQLSLEGRDELSKARTLDEKTAAMAKIQKASNGFDTINKFNNDYVAKQEDIKKNFDKYDPNYLLDMAEEGKKFDNGQYEYSLDDDYNVKFNTHDIDPATGKVSAITGKNLSADELLSKFTGLSKSNYAGEGDGVSFLDNFSKRIKEKKEETKVNGKIVTSYPAAIADAEAAAKAAVSDPSLRYNVRTQMAKQLNVPKSEITDEQVYQKILNDTKSLIPKDKSEVDYQAANYNLSVRREINDQNQRAIDNARNAKKDAKEDKEDNTKTTYIKEHTLKESSVPGTGIIVPPNSARFTVNSKGYKDVSGATRMLQNVVVTPQGEVFYGVNQKGVDKAQLTPAAKEQKRTDLKNFDPNNENNYVHTERVVWKKSGKHGSSTALTILNTENPDTGENFKSIEEADNWARKNAFPKTKTEAKKEYTNVTETSKGTIGVYNGKWYDIKTGKEIK